MKIVIVSLCISEGLDGGGRRVAEFHMRLTF